MEGDLKVTKKLLVLTLVLVVIFVSFTSFCVGWADECGLAKPGILGQKSWTPRTDMTAYPNSTPTAYSNPFNPTISSGNNFTFTSPVSLDNGGDSNYKTAAITQNLEDEHQFQNTNYHSSILNMVPTYVPAMEKESRPKQEAVLNVNYMMTFAGDQLARSPANEFSCMAIDNENLVAGNRISTVTATFESGAQKIPITSTPRASYALLTDLHRPNPLPSGGGKFIG